MTRKFWLGAAGLVTALAGAAWAFAAWSQELPGGYHVLHGDRGKAWLARPDGSLVHGGVVKEVRTRDNAVLLIAVEERGGGDDRDNRKAIPPDCFVALVIDARTHRVQQVGLDRAQRLGETMRQTESYERRC